MPLRQLICHFDSDQALGKRIWKRAQLPAETGTLAFRRPGLVRELLK